MTKKIQLEININSLSALEVDVLKMRFAIGYEKTLRQKEIAKALDISVGRVSQIEKKALTKIRNKINLVS
ncbi:MAG: RNA polymerase subunit sigma-70 [Gammaproteobacteria bacterium]|nr:RNA polymerase subunit sigma-70 [Gammaproteobacteria bacterium]